MSKTTLAVLFLSLATILSGCGMNSLNIVNPPSVSAQAPPPVTCNDDGVCDTKVIASWGYYQYSTYESPKTFSGAVEIGVNQNIADANQSIVGLPLAFPGNITSFSGDIDYRSWGKNPASMIVEIRACTDANCTYPTAQEHLMLRKFTADAGSHETQSFAVKFATPVHADHLMLIFNDDLANAKPTTISVGFSGEFK